MPINNRLYTIPDPELVTSANLFIEELRTFVTDFTVFDQSIDLTYPLEIAKLLNDLSSIKPDVTFVTQQAELTEKVANLMRQGRELYGTLSFFIRKAFADNQSIYQQFGLREYGGVRTNVQKMIVFLEVIKEQVLINQEHLDEIGCQSTVLLSNLEQVILDLRTAVLMQDVVRRDRKQMTELRVKKLNEIYLLLRNIEKIANFIYKDSPEKLQKFTLPVRRKKIVKVTASKA
ncbi:hypothetical protein [Sediminitomix flava]|uniref:Uncharacterized protein n=1 Tax=Sediminitomix flava TaxID=379075 RepID=A0A315ZGT6_SEDFL|nr:hypothetical protein [Sediminitomix flava]PWJ44815.1 hypothetical protein BC781_1011194 [Sediminitomix flava]